MSLFLDTCTLIAASGSSSCASRQIFNDAPKNGWTLITTLYGLNEALTNIHKLKLQGAADWAKLRPQLLVMDDVRTIDRPVVFEIRKDRPILFGAYTWSDILITLDTADFGTLLGDRFYGLQILTPGRFLRQERLAARLL